MNTPKIGGCAWFAKNTYRGAIYNRNFHVEGKWQDSGHPDPWVAHEPDSGEHFFPTYEDARSHMIKEGWRK